ncbi:MAG: hypothetical protein HY22_08345 [[Candidatus Thermochlorobacteriaceae] bacterium GBChlB]|nr:MAG: hypothetical protein HY22_08345 [[Candidatus Thermochlorobacteriaceae] bacterium GBChlB]
MFKPAWTLTGFFVSAISVTVILGFMLIFAMPFFLLALLPLVAALFFLFGIFEDDRSIDTPRRRPAPMPRADRDALFHSEKHQFTIRQYDLN